ncbi:MAG: polysaccharide biosynthesis protein [Planctomycetota bacterium]
MRGSQFKDSAILVTGGTGTIGSEIVRQLLAFEPGVVRILSRDETKQAELRVALGPHPNLRYLIGDIRDADRLRCALEDIDLVFHAAALKHVPACEYNPFEAVQTNVVGTQNLIQACRSTGVKRLVLISTDKAVNPQNTMGATKLLAENLVRASQEWNSRLAMCTVRFGNVLGSRGSLVPLLLRQIRERNEVELTSRLMTRFMMTIEDAVGLVLTAASVCQGGELYILKMPALRVADLVAVVVEEYCEFTGVSPGAIAVRESGVRRGEKIHEELITREEFDRLETQDNLYVVRSTSSVSSPGGNQLLPDEFNSERSARLSRAEIRAMLRRAGVLASIEKSQPVETVAV